MQRPDSRINLLIVLLSLILLTSVLMSGCVKPSEYCPQSTFIDLSDANSYSNDSKLPFRFPVDNLTSDQLLGAIFASYGYASSSPDSKEYHRQGKSLTKGGCIRVAQYTRLRFYHQKKRWKRVFSISLNSVVQDEDGSETEMIQTITAKKGIDLDTWIDAKNHYQSSSQRVKRAIRKFLYEDWRRLSGYDWKLIRQFREEAKQKVVVD